MRLTDALDQIAAIRQQVAGAAAFRGYRSLTTFFSGVVAVAASHYTAVLQARGELSDDADLGIWCGAATLCLAVVGIELVLHVRRSGSALQRDLTWEAVEQFMPSLAAGLLLTFVLFRFAYEVTWVLPGLWMILFGLGIHSSKRLLPRFSGIIAGYYIACGLFVLSLKQWAAFNPWTMGGVFGFGQFMAAGLLRCTEWDHAKAKAADEA